MTLNIDAAITAIRHATICDPDEAETVRQDALDILEPMVDFILALDGLEDERVQDVMRRFGVRI